jgi:hypothetical protein
MRTHRRKTKIFRPRQYPHGLMRALVWICETKVNYCTVSVTVHECCKVAPPEPVTVPRTLMV